MKLTEDRYIVGNEGKRNIKVTKFSSRILL